MTRNLSLTLCKLAASVLLERAFAQVFKRAEERIEFLKKRKYLRDSK
jgi:hypothetical protein